MKAESGRPVEELSIACELSEEGQDLHRREELSREIFGACEGVTELDDGYEFVFQGDPERIGQLARFVGERECCRFFAFELIFEPDLGPISLKVRGLEGTREFLRGQFTEEFARAHSLKRF